MSKVKHCLTPAHLNVNFELAGDRRRILKVLYEIKMLK